MPWLTGWNYRKSHVINQQAGAGTNYQSRIIINRSVGVDAGENVYIGENCELDRSDIRFTEDDGETLLDYWHEVREEWVSRQVLPAVRGDVSACVINDKLYVFGGYSAGAQSEEEVWEYDPSTNNWTAMDNMTTDRWGMIAVAYNGKAYVFGGQQTGVGLLNTLEIFDPSQSAGNQWSNGANMPVSVQGIMGVYFSYDGFIHLFGGYNGVALIDIHFVYKPDLDAYDDPSYADMPAGRNWGTCSVVGDNIYVIGGASGLSPTIGSNTCWRYNPATNNWTVLTAMPANRWGATRENPVINNMIYVTHGQHPDTSYHQTVFEYDVAKDEWNTLDSGINARDGVGCGVIDGQLYVVGGRVLAVPKDQHERWNPAGYMATWVEVSGDLSAGNITIYMYYGNSSAPAVTNGPNTMLDFDDFNNNALDPLWTIDKTGGGEAISEINRKIDITHRINSFCHIEKAMTDDPIAIQAKFISGTFAEGSWALSLTVYFNLYDYASMELRNPTYQVYGIMDKNAVLTAIAGGNNTWTANTWKWLRIRVIAGTVYFDHSDDGLTWINLGSTARPPTWDTPDLSILGHGYEERAGAYPNPDLDNQFSSLGASSKTYTETYFVRKYVNPEPVHGAWGSEESPPSGGISVMDGLVMVG